MTRSRKRSDQTPDVAKISVPRKVHDRLARIGLRSRRSVPNVISVLTEDEEGAVAALIGNAVILFPLPASEPVDA